MSSSPTFTVVDQFDEDEFPTFRPRRPRCRPRCDPRKPRGLRHGLTSILAVAACAVIAGARSFVAIAEWAKDTIPAVLVMLGVTGQGSKR